MSYSNMIFKWTCHGSTNCPKCQALDGVTKPIGEWQIQPGFHPNCDCTLDLVGWEEFRSEPTIFVSITSYFITAYADQFNPVKSTKPVIQFPLCPYFSNQGQSSRSPESLVPALKALFPKNIDVPSPVRAPSVPAPKPYNPNSTKRFG